MVCKVRFESILRALATAGLGLVLSSISTPAGADVDLYLAPQIGISSIKTETDGRAQFAATFGFKGEDTDESPLVGAALGVEIPMNEIVPREWLADIRLPNWPIRFEVEATFLRDYELKTNGAGASAANYLTELDALVFTANAWFDLPMLTAWRPFQYVFGLGRQPRVRQYLEPMNFYFGSGVGFTDLEIRGTDNVFSGNDSSLDFAWTVGTGINYALTDRVKLSAGYRYLSLGPNTDSQSVALTGGPGLNNEQRYDFQVHEFRFGVQVRVWSFAGVWR